MGGACGKYEGKKRNMYRDLVQKPGKKKVIWWSNEQKRGGYSKVSRMCRLGECGVVLSTAVRDKWYA